MPLTTYNIVPNTILHQDTIGVYPITFGGNIVNTYDRIRQTAELVGHTILLVELIGQDGNNIRGIPPREALKPGEAFDATCQYFADEIAPLIEPYDIRLGIGHSIGGVLIAGMYLNSTVGFNGEGLLSGINHADSFNLRSRFRGTQKPIAGYSGYLAYQVKDAALQTIPFTSHKPAIKTLYNPNEHGVSPKGPSLITNIRNVGPLMRSSVSIETAVELSRRVDLPYNVVGLQQGLSGPYDRIATFHQDLQSNRYRAAKKYEASGYHKAADISTRVVPGRHSMLMDPALVARHTKMTRVMVFKYRQDQL